MNNKKEELEEEKELTLQDVPKGSIIECDCSDGSTFIIFEHLDGLYSYCTTEKGAVVHLGRHQPLKKIIEVIKGEEFNKVYFKLK